MNQLNLLDGLVVALFFLAVFGIAAYYSKKAGKDTKQFFLSGRNMPWYIAGTAMVATTFAADTPLAVTELVAKNGISGNWLWWNMAIGGMLTVFLYARLWRRSGIMTDVEFIEFRYSGRPAAVLRGFRALYLGLFMNAIVMGWVHKAMEKIFQVTVPVINPFILVVTAALIIAIYSSASGLLGTARTDSFQFLFAMTGCVVLAVIVIKLPQIGGMIGLREKLAPQVISFFPRIETVSAAGITGGALALSAGAFFAYIGLQWWSSWYPGADPGGGGYIAQRMMSAKDEKHSLFATLWFNIAHFTIRPWPWIIVALCALILLPRAESPEILHKQNPVLYQKVVKAYSLNKNNMETDEDAEFSEFYEKYENTVDPGIMYPKLMMRFLPSGLRGFLIAVFLAAYMSTIASQLNWGTSYLINDLYRRFVKRDAPEKHYVLISRMGIIVMITFSLLITRLFLTTISGAWIFIINASAGIGAVLLLRWYWWRINAWSEISAMIAPLIIYPLSTRVFGIQPPITLYPTVLGTTAVWITVTLLTKPVSSDKITTFYTRVHPGGIGWKKIAKDLPNIKSDKGYVRLLIDWLCGVILIYSMLFGFGNMLFGEYIRASLYIAVGTASAAVIYFDLKKRGFKTITE